MTDKLRQAAQAALELWDAPSDTPWFAYGNYAMNALRAALAEQPEPCGKHCAPGYCYCAELAKQPEPVRLTESEIEACEKPLVRALLDGALPHEQRNAFARAIEAAVLKANGLGEK